MNNYFFSSLPFWIIQLIKNKICGGCKKDIFKKDIVGVGIRKLDDSEDTTPYVEFCCSHCNHRSILTFSSQMKGSLEDVCLMLLESIRNKKQMHSSIGNEKTYLNTNITDEEVSKFIKYMNDNKVYDDFLKEIGASDYSQELENES
jgi:hypothetical protein